MQEALVHIGYHKTGSTWLQTQLFNQNRCGFAMPVPDADLISHLQKPHRLEFDVESCKAALLPRMEAARAQGLIPVVTRENLSGDPHYQYLRNCEWADRLAATFEGARVLIVVREQASCIRTFYQQDIRSGASGTITEYLSPPPRCRRLSPFFPEHFSYDRLVDYYYSLFGRERVLVLAFEEFVRDGPGYVEKICRFCGIETPKDLPYGEKTHPSISAWGAGMKSRLNRVWAWNPDEPRKSAQWPLDMLVRRIDRSLPASLKDRYENHNKVVIREFVEERYRESNRKLMQLTDLPLDEYGYQV